MQFVLVGAVAVLLGTLNPANLRDVTRNPALGQGTPQSKPTAPLTAQRDKPPKKPAPPLLPKRRRGQYLNGQGLEVMDFTPQSPPLVTDDPSVPDKHEFELNLSSFVERTPEQKDFDLFLVDANYGLLPKLFGRELPTQIKFEFPIAGAREGVAPFESGLGPAAAGLKFVLFENEHQGVQVSAYPQLEFPLAGNRSIEKGLSDPGQTFVFPVLVSRQTHYLTLVANAGVEVPLHDPDREVMAKLGLAGGVAIRRKLAAMAEIRTESRPNFHHDRLVVVTAGIMRGFRGNIAIYGTIGRSVFADDGLTHIYAGFGLKIIRGGVEEPKAGRK